MRYVVAFLGAVFVFVCAFLLLSVIIGVAAPFLLVDISIDGIHTNNPVGFLLAALAATASFGATLKRYGKKRRADGSPTASAASTSSPPVKLSPPPPPAR
jgi:hypothetical protein